MSDLISYLTYCSYKANRDYSPEVTPEQWKAVYGPAVEQMEAKYQQEEVREQQLEQIREDHYDRLANT